MIQNFVIYTTGRGEILRVGICSTKHISIQALEGESLLEVTDLLTDYENKYVDETQSTPVVTDRPFLDLLIANGTVEYTPDFSALPAGSTGTIETNAGIVTAFDPFDTVDPLVFKNEGTFTLRLLPPWPIMELEQQLEVTNA